MYTPLEIYTIVGKYDRTAFVTLKKGSEAHNRFGDDITVVFLYTQAEREAMDLLLVKSSPGESIAYVKARYLRYNLPSETSTLLSAPGILSSDIASIFSPGSDADKSEFHSFETRQLNKIEIPFRALPKGQDFDWQYGFDKSLWHDGVGFSPTERINFLVKKFYYEPELLTDEETAEIFDDEGLKEDARGEYLTIVYFREEASQADKDILLGLMKKKQAERFNALNSALQKVGSSIKKLIAKNKDKAIDLCIKVNQFHEHRLNVNGKIPIYLDLKGYLHIWMGHVEEMKINNLLAHKDNFR